MRSGDGSLQADAHVRKLGRESREVPRVSFVSHVRSNGVVRLLFFQLPALIVVLSVLYLFDLLLATPTGSYYCQLLLLALFSTASVAVYPDKLTKLLATPAAFIAGVSRSTSHGSPLAMMHFHAVKMSANLRACANRGALRTCAPSVS
jgi:hypothetical protein